MCSRWMPPRGCCGGTGKSGEAEHALVAVRGDHGMAGVTRGKCHLDDFGTHLAIAMPWPAMCPVRRAAFAPRTTHGGPVRASGDWILATVCFGWMRTVSRRCTVLQRALASPGGGRKIRPRAPRVFL